MKKLFVLFFISLAVGTWADSDITIQRAKSNVNAGFRERVYIDGKQVAALANGDSGTVRVSSGNHEIYAELYTLVTPKLMFNAGSNDISFTITPYSTKNFVVEQTGIGGPSPQPAAQPPAQSTAQAPARPAAQPTVQPAAQPTAPPPAPRPPTSSNSVEGSLEQAADKIMEKIPERARVAIVYVTAEDKDVAEFIAGELEFFMVDNDRIVIDRSQLDRIRQEQRLQMSGEVDDRQAVNIGKLAGADIIITGAITGRGDLRRLRLRALDTQTAQVLSVASEKY